jgi:glycosyltransferase involved in cell wall biosynthesis
MTNRTAANQSASKRMIPTSLSLTTSVDNVTSKQTAQSNEQVISLIDEAMDRIDQLSTSLEEVVVPQVDYELPKDFMVSIVIPVYNEETTIRDVISRVKQLPLPKEIIVVDDCSTDGTRRALSQLENLSGIRIIYKSKNEGKGAALRTGFAAATGDVVCIQDADFEYDPRDIIELIRPIVEGVADVVYGSRFLGNARQDPSILHRLGNRTLTWFSNRFTGLKLTDMETCYKAFPRKLLNKIEIEQDRFGVEPEITAKIARLNCRVLEIPIRYDGRGYKEGKKIGLKDGFEAIYCIVRYGLN